MADKSLITENFFTSETQCPTVLKQIYENSVRELWISFAQSEASLFHETIKVTDGDKCSTESTLAVKTLLLKLKACRYIHFILHMVKNLLSDSEQDDKMTMRSYFRTLKEFYETALCYLEAWNKHNENLLKWSCCLLDKVSTWENSDNVIDLLSLECEILTINTDEISLNTLIYAIIYHEKKVNS
jgi:predicted ABC-type ATPase